MKMEEENGTHRQIIQVIQHFDNVFGDPSTAVMNICPASLMLLGDHTHYNEGILISACIDKYWIYLIRKRKDDEIYFASIGTNEIETFSLKNLDAGDKESFKLLKGILKYLHEFGLIKFGFDCVVSSTVPECLGLGSYAAYQIGFLNTLKKLFNLNLDEERLLNIVLKNEVGIIGRISNAAHHYTVRYGKEKKLFFTDLRTRTHKSLPLRDANYSIVICDTSKKIVDAQKICKERIEECEVGVRGLRLYIWGIKSLRDVELEFLHKHLHMLPRRIFSRILYNVKEKKRTEDALKGLRKKTMDEFGGLINQSHWSLVEDYDLSFDENNFLVQESSKISGVIGSKTISCSPIRSTFHLVANNKVDEYTKEIKKLYESKFHSELKTYVVKLTGGVKKISHREIEFSLQ